MDETDETDRGASLRDRVVVVTGASSGIGRAVARLFAQRRARLVLAGRSESRLSALVRELGGETVAVSGDLTEPDEADRLIAAAIERFSRVDVLFANAGIYVSGSVAEGDPGAWEQLIDTNVTAVFRVVHAALGAMIAQRSGDIVITSSVSGHQAIPWEPVYSASKHAVQAFVHGLRRQVSEYGVRVGSLAPGRVLNELWGIGADDIEPEVAAGTGVRSEDVAEALEFMVSRPPHVTIRDLVILPFSQDI
ncbi:MAG TPA: SDR family oxidoreductase [Acidimicrobiales bacterium]|nr:SDR family oxidoreductase [Acidimicrobiales bacterium]